MLDNRKLNENDIGNIILCDPITSRGIEALTALGITPDEITPSFFYENIFTPSKYDENVQTPATNTDSMNEALYYRYTSTNQQIEAIQNQMRIFNERFDGSSVNGYPILIFGVAGNGKSIETYRRIRSWSNENGDFECGKAYLDLESAFSEVTYGDTYMCPNDRNALWLLTIKLMDGIMKYIIENIELCPTISMNFNDKILRNNLANECQRKVFDLISKYTEGDNETQTELFKSIKEIANDKDPETVIKKLLTLLMMIMFCSNPDNKNFIVFDNIEQYIKLNSAKTQIYNSDIAAINRIVNGVTTNITNLFDRIEHNISWKSFKIIIVLRRTSLGLLDPVLLQTPVRGYENSADLTGHFQIPEIWAKKKRYIWKAKLEKDYQNEYSKNLIELVDIIMSDGVNTRGTPYQSLIAPLMSYGIRRNARSQAHASSELYKLLVINSDEVINYEQFVRLILSATSQNGVRYMFRRALMEIQFKWSIGSGKQERWKALNIGHLSNQKVILFENKSITVEGVSYDDEENITFLRRILAFLSLFPEKNTFIDARDKSVIDMFSTISICELAKGVLVNPAVKIIAEANISQEDYKHFSKVLIALSNMSYYETKTAPFVILGIKDEKFDKNPTAENLTKLLVENMKDYSSDDSNTYLSDFNVRITDAGYSFMLDWLSSFSFISAMYCFTIPPLFLLRDVCSIKYVIKTVYEATVQLCEKYENEAIRFCGSKNTLRNNHYLPKHKEKCFTYKERVKELHLNHLWLYTSYLESNAGILGISTNDKTDILSYVSRYIDQYKLLNTSEESAECF